MAENEATAIIFIDGSGVHWEVRELQSPGLQGIAPEQMSLPEFRNGWLLFTADNGERRRLAPFPADWRSLSHHGLASLAARARRAPGHELPSLAGRSEQPSRP
ncbi:MAG: hypothetical protein NVS4B3_27970 [Gemmatimonadaceae bacterium]